MSSIDQTNTLTRLFIKNFRNIDEMNLSFSKSHNLFIGKNGHGKTNCLEAIALVASLKPMQSLQNGDLINQQSHQAKLIAHFEGTSSFDLELDILGAGKKVKLNSQALKSAQKLQEQISLVSFIPSELNMIQGFASLRRRALDQAACGLYFEHSVALKAYEKLLLHRNRLLKDGLKDKETLNAFTSLLVEQGAKVMFLRLATLEKMQDEFKAQLGEILGPTHEGELTYWQNEPLKNYGLLDLKARLLDQYKLLAHDEVRRRCTLFGPHLDDMVFSIDGMDAKKYSSRGQSRALVLAFKLAHMLSITSIRGQAPVIILDDIVSELDQERKLNLIATINKIQAQAFFSATDLETFGCDQIELFTITNGKITQ